MGKQFHEDNENDAASKLENLRRRLEAAQTTCQEIESVKQVAADRAKRSETDAEDLQEKLVCVLEAKRIAESRLDELKRAMLSMEKHHEAVIVDLKQQLLLAKGSQPESVNSGDSDLTADEVKDLRHQLRGSKEERNVLLNTLEWKEVQWKNK